jgi:hypothetical protein
MVTVVVDVTVEYRCAWIDEQAPASLAPLWPSTSLTEEVHHLQKADWQS